MSNDYVWIVTFYNGMQQDIAGVYNNINKAYEKYYEKKDAGFIAEIGEYIIE